MKKLFLYIKNIKLRNKILLFFAIWAAWGLIDVNNWQKAPLRDAANFKPYQDSAGMVARLSEQSKTPFIAVGETVSEKEDTRFKSALNNFPTVLDCLQKSEWNKPNPDLTKIDWDKIDWNEEAEVCLFRIASSYEDSPYAMMKWFKKTNIDTNPNIFHVNNDPDNIYFSVDAVWNNKKTGKSLFAKNWAIKKWLMLISYGFSLRVFYDSNNNLTEVDVSDNTIM